MTRPRRLVGTASILLDVTVRVPALPPRGGDVLGEDGGRSPGGGINALAAAARLGLPAAYAAPHGTGPAGDAVRAALAADGITALTPTSPHGDTGNCLVLVEPDGQRTFVTVPGVEARQEPEVLAGLALEPGDVVYVSGYDLLYPVSGPALAPWLARLPDEVGVVLDPGPLAADVPGDLFGSVLGRADAVTLAAEELTALGGLRSVTEGMRPDGVLVRRDGADGATLLLPRPSLHVPVAAAPAPVVDTTGAGDVHTGALVAGLARGLRWREALTVAAAAAAWAVTRPGASTGPRRDQLAADFPAVAALLDDPGPR